MCMSLHCHPALANDSLQQHWQPPSCHYKSIQGTRHSTHTLPAQLAEPQATASHTATSSTSRVTGDTDSDRSAADAQASHARTAVDDYFQGSGNTSYQHTRTPLAPQRHWHASHAPCTHFCRRHKISPNPRQPGLNSTPLKASSSPATPVYSLSPVRGWRCGPAQQAA